MSLFANFYMFFYKNKIQRTLPGACRCLNCSHKKREAPQCTCKKGSLTVEAAIILPMFAGFFAFLLFYFRVMGVQIIVQEALEEIGRNLAMLSVRELEEPEVDNAYFALAKGMLYTKLKDDELVGQYVSGGAVGVSLMSSEFEEDYILLNANYVMRFPVKFFGIQDFLICQKTRFRKWNGWHELSEDREAIELVYVTEYGEVYHMRRNCTYLELSIQRISCGELKTKRNYNGTVYKECELCSDEKTSLEIVYITNYGERYHKNIGCSGLKRTIYQKRLAEVGGMPACMKCSK